MKARRIFPLCLALLLTANALFCLAACLEGPVMPGDIASVNGQGISFREAEARRVSLFARRSPGDESLDNATLQAQYRHVVAELIEEVLVSQFMRDKGVVLPPELLEAEEARIRSDYPEGAFEEMLLEDGVSLDLWREGIRRRLIMEQFMTQELRPEISIAADEVQQYFKEHSQDFIIPEQWHFMQIMGLDRKEVDRARQAFIAGRNATAVQKEFLVTIHDIRMGKELLPDELSQELAGLESWQGSRTKAHDDGFRSFILIEKAPSSVLDAATISQRVEQALAEEKMRSIYEEWLRKHLAKADIRLAPVLTDPIGGAFAPAESGALPEPIPAGGGTNAPLGAQP